MGQSFLLVLVPLLKWRMFQFGIGKNDDPHTSDEYFDMSYYLFHNCLELSHRMQYGYYN